MCTIPFFYRFNNNKFLKNYILYSCIVFVLFFISFFLVVVIELVARTIVVVSAPIRVFIILLIIKPFRDLVNVFKNIFFDIEKNNKDTTDIYVYGIKATIRRIWSETELN